MITLLPMYVVHCARLANPDPNWTQESLTNHFRSWLSGLAASLRSDQPSQPITILSGTTMPREISRSLTQHFGMNPGIHTDEFLEALSHCLAISGSRPLGRPGRFWARLSNSRALGDVTLTSLPLPLDSWATERDINVRTSS